jgi:hypothetical protein
VQANTLPRLKKAGSDLVKASQYAAQVNARIGPYGETSVGPVPPGAAGPSTRWGVLRGGRLAWLGATAADNEYIVDNRKEVSDLRKKITTLRAAQKENVAVLASLPSCRCLGGLDTTFAHMTAALDPVRQLHFELLENSDLGYSYPGTFFARRAKVICGESWVRGRYLTHTHALFVSRPAYEDEQLDRDVAHIVLRSRTTLDGKAGMEAIIVCGRAGTLVKDYGRECKYMRSDRCLRPRELPPPHHTNTPLLGLSPRREAL